MKHATHHTAPNRGFTLVEMMVSVALFAVVMVVSAGALLSLATANRKAQALQSVMNNLNITLDSMVRSIREGSNYHCGTTGIITTPRDCGTGDEYLAILPHGLSVQRVYRFVPPTGTQSGYIERSENGGANYVRITATEVSITDMKFFVVGTTPGDTQQPKVVVILKGTAGGINTKITTTFHIQATAVQRLLDI